jgi:hypothetical protein
MEETKLESAIRYGLKYINEKRNASYSALREEQKACLYQLIVTKL